MASQKMTRRQRIHKRVRQKITGTAERPRLAIYRSNTNIYGQLIDDIAGNTLAAASSLDNEIAGKEGNKSEIAKLVGELLAKRAIEKGIKTVTFDRGGYLYHGRVKAFADGARGNKLEDGSNELLQF